jgi:UDP-glucose 4-epimerase
MTTWITGARGFIGRHLARSLANQGHTIIGVGPGTVADADAATWGVTRWLNGEIGASNLQALLNDHGAPETVFHLAGGASVGAGLANPREDFFRTVTTSVELLEWLRQVAPKTRLVVVSSAAVYGLGHDGAIAESTAPAPSSPYAHHKLMMESLCRSYGNSFGLPSVVARLFSVYGAGQRKQLLWDLCSQLEAGTGDINLSGSGDERRDWTDVRDAVRALARLPALAAPTVPAVNVASGRAVTVREVAQQVLASWQPTPSGRVLRFSGQQRQGDPFSLHAECGHFDSIGFECQVPWRTGVADYVRWFQARPRSIL